MIRLFKYSLGIDVDKKNLHVCLLTINVQQQIKICSQRKFANTPKGHEQLVKWLIKWHHQPEIPLFVTVEATGIYHERIALHLHQIGYQLSVVLPNKAKQYMKSLGLKSKTDKIDARGLAQYGAQQMLPLWQPAAPEYYELKALTRHKERLEKLLTEVRNQLGSMKESAFVNDLIINHLEDTVKHLKAQAKAVKRQMQTLVNSQPDTLLEQMQYATSIPGVGLIVGSVVLSETYGFAEFHNERQLVSYSGYDVVLRDSGGKKTQGRISKQGNSHIRRVLHLAAWRVVAQGVPHFVNLYKRVLERTGVKMKAYVAVQRKLLTTIYALVKKQELFDSKYHQQQAQQPELEKAKSVLEGHQVLLS